MKNIPYIMFYLHFNYILILKSFFFYFLYKLLKKKGLKLRYHTSINLIFKFMHSIPFTKHFKGYADIIWFFMFLF